MAEREKWTLGTIVIEDATWYCVRDQASQIVSIMRTPRDAVLESLRVAAWRKLAVEVVEGWLPT